MSPPGLMRSALKNGQIRRRSTKITVTWTPSTSQLGVNFFCYTATDNFGCVRPVANFAYKFIQIIMVVSPDWIYYSIHNVVFIQSIVWLAKYKNRNMYVLAFSSLSLCTARRLTSKQSCITFLVGGNFKLTVSNAHVCTCLDWHYMALICIKYEAL